MKAIWRISLVLPLFLLVLACAEQPGLTARYAVERLVYQAGRLVDSAPFEAAALYARAQRQAVAASKRIDRKTNQSVALDLRDLAFESTQHLNRLYLEQNEPDSAAAYANLLLANVELSPGQAATAGYALGQALQRGGHWAAALTVYDNLLAEHYPPRDDSGLVIVDLIDLPLHLYRLTSLFQSADSATRRLARSEGYYLGLLGNTFEAAITTASRANLAELYRQAGQPGRALEQLTLLPNAESPAVLMARAELVAEDFNQPDSAVKILEMARRMMPPSDTVWMPALMQRTATYLAESGRPGQARAELVELKRQFPSYYHDHPAIQRAIGESFEAEGNFTRAEAEYRYLIERFRGSDEALATCFQIGVRLRSSGRPSEAARWRQEADEMLTELTSLRGDPSVAARVEFWRAETALTAGDTTEAITRLTRVQADCPHEWIGRRAAWRALELTETDEPSAMVVAALLRTSIIARGDFD